MPDVNLLDEYNLRQLSNCPKCGANWEDLNYKLYAGTSKEYRKAIRQMQGCEICTMRFAQVDFEMIGVK